MLWATPDRATAAIDLELVTKLLLLLLINPTRNGLRDCAYGHVSTSPVRAMGIRDRCRLSVQSKFGLSVHTANL